MATLLSVDGLSKSFGGITAVEGVSFDVAPAEVFAIIGPNGAGKSTIFNLLSLIYRPDSGTIMFDTTDLRSLRPHQVAARGIGRTFQNIELFENATVLQNLLVACHARARFNVLQEMLFTPAARRRECEYRLIAERVIRFLKLQDVRDRLVRTLPYGTRKNVELARALCTQPKLLLLDEPSSGLNDDETIDIGTRILAIRDGLGTSVILIEHDMTLVSMVSDRVLAISYGRPLAIGRPPEVQGHPDVVSAYLG